MTFWLALRRLLPLLAVLSLALTPVTASAAAAGMHASMAADDHGMAGMDMAGMDMPCCPQDEGGPPDASHSDCAKGCPLMALCLASVVSLLPAALPIPVPAATRASPSWPDPAAFATLHGPPLPEPPRA